ncbi:7310_t:CDS:2, partial [Racocetra fulgida]
MSKDLTKLFFHDEDKDDIDGFLFDYERYAKSKSWDEETQSVGSKTNKDKDTVLKNIKQVEKETVQGYASRFEAYMDSLNNTVRNYEKCDWFLNSLLEAYRSKVEAFCPSNYAKAKDCTLQIESFQKNREFNYKRRALTMGEEKPSVNADIDNMTAVFEALTINQVKQETSDERRIDRIESDISEIVKTVRQLAENHMDQIVLTMRTPGVINSERSEEPKDVKDNP